MEDKNRAVSTLTVRRISSRITTLKVLCKLSRESQGLYPHSFVDLKRVDSPSARTLVEAVFIASYIRTSTSITLFAFYVACFVS